MKMSFLASLPPEGQLSLTPSEEIPPRVVFPFSLQKSRSRGQELPSSTAKQNALCIKQDYVCYYVTCFKCFRKGMTLGDQMYTSGQ